MLHKKMNSFFLMIPMYHKILQNMHDFPKLNMLSGGFNA